MANIPGSNRRELEGIPVFSALTEADIIAAQGLQGRVPGQFTVAITDEISGTTVHPDQTEEQVKQLKADTSAVVNVYLQQ